MRRPSEAHDPKASGQGGVGAREPLPRIGGDPPRQGGYVEVDPGGSQEDPLRLTFPF